MIKSSQKPNVIVFTNRTAIKAKINQEIIPAKENKNAKPEYSDVRSYDRLRTVNATFRADARLKTKLNMSEQSSIRFPPNIFLN